MITSARTTTKAIATLVGLGLVAASLTACSVTTGTTTESTSVVQSADVTAAALWDSTFVHTIELVVDPADLQGVIDTYLATGEKEWVSATVIIDGQTFTDVGLKLKGNSTLRVVTAQSDPTTLPWVIRLDKYVDDQSLDGETELVVRGNSTETAINEALALELLSLSGLAAQEAVASRFIVNGGSTQLRLVIQNPNDGWDAQEFGTTGLLYKAESGGDYSYRGDDPASYTDIFDQEAGDDNLEPLIDFLRFINESSDSAFAAELDQFLDIDAFATYLAYQDLVDNFDDIDGPGNNSYLHYDETTGIMTVVNWDLNLAFGTSNVDGGAGGQNRPGVGAGQDRAPVGGAPVGGEAGGAAGGAGGPSSGNVLSERFLDIPEFAALVAAATTELTETLYTSGAAEQALAEWSAVLTTQADDLVSAATVAAEADAVRASFARYLAN